MTPETETNINEAIDWLQKTGAALQDFASEHAPIYCREVVAWELWSSVFFGGLGFTLFSIGLVAAVKWFRWMVEYDGEPNGRTIPSFFIAVLSLGVGTILLFVNAPQAIKAAVSPRLVIVEHLSKLRK